MDRVVGGESVAGHEAPCGARGVAEGYGEVVDRQEQGLVAGDGVVQQTRGTSAGTSVGSVLSPAAPPAFLERDCEYGLGQLDREQVASRDRYAALVDPVQEGATYCVKGLRGYQRLDYEASVECDRIGQEKLSLLNGEDAARGGLASACRGHDLPTAVHVRRDANLDPESLRGAL